jgi:hypothetical protein
MSHRHYCDFAGHDWKCSSQDCECLCGFPTEGHDHSECPVELRACPEHALEEQRRIQEAISHDPESIQKWHERLSTRPHCDCGCAEADMSKIVGFCLHCDHTYAEFSPEIQDRHFAYHCTGAPEELRQSARQRFVEQ